MVRPFDVPEHWSRFESIDFGHNNPTAYLVWLADEDGNLVVVDEYYSPGLASEHAPQILGRRRRWGLQGYPYCYGDPSMWSEYGLTNKRGMPASIATELNDHGVTGLLRANNDRAAGYLRLRELLHPEPGRIPPPWAQLSEEVAAAPRLYIFEGCTNLIEQVKNAPTTTKGRSVDIADTVEAEWETRHGHAHAALRYGAMSRPRPAERMADEPDDWASWKKAELLRRYDEAQENPNRKRYEWA